MGVVEFLLRNDNCVRKSWEMLFLFPVFVRGFEGIHEVCEEVAPHIRSLDEPYLARLNCVGCAQKFRVALAFCLFLGLLSSFVGQGHKIKLGPEKCDV